MYVPLLYIDTLHTPWSHTLTLTSCPTYSGLTARLYTQNWASLQDLPMSQDFHLWEWTHCSEDYNLFQVTLQMTDHVEVLTGPCGITTIIPNPSAYDDKEFT